jgi:hypothetical protein
MSNSRGVIADVQGLPDGDVKMAMTLSIDERALLYSALDQWEGLLARVGVR